MSKSARSEQLFQRGWKLKEQNKNMSSGIGSKGYINYSVAWKWKDYSYGIQ